MKKTVLTAVVLAPAFAAMLCFAVAACASTGNSAAPKVVGENPEPETPAPGETENVPGNTLAERLQWLRVNAESGRTYTLEVTEDETLGNQEMDFNGKTDITVILKGIGSERVISFSGDRALFHFWDMTLVLDENITLRGNDNDKRGWALIVMERAESSLFMNDGAKIIGNYGGVVGGNGTFTMNGGEISNNTGDVGSVNVNGTFTMNGGEITNNTARIAAVLVSGNAVSTMSGGKISGNDGIGLGISSTTFTMNGGEISGNTMMGVDMEGPTTHFIMNDGKISANKNGGGVHVNGGTFTMNGGEIYGNTGRGSYGYGGGVGVSNYDEAGYDESKGFRLVSGTIYGSNETDSALRNTSASNQGAALFVRAADPVNGAIQAAAEYGTYVNGEWVRSGSLSTTNNTIRAVNGVLQ